MEEKKSPVIVIYLVVIIGVLLVLMFFIPSFFSDTNVSNGGRAAYTVAAAHQYTNGKHIYKGAIDLPTPCHALSTRVIENNSPRESVTLSFVTINTVSAESACAQVITPQTFLASFFADKNIDVTAMVNNKEAKFIVTEATSDLFDN